MLKKIMFFVVLSICASNAVAVEQITGNVTHLEPTRLPSKILFKLDTGNDTCPAGKWLTWSKSDENNKATYATLLTAMVSEKKINFFFSDGDISCDGNYMHFLAD